MVGQVAEFALTPYPASARPTGLPLPGDHGDSTFLAGPENRLITTAVPRLLPEGHSSRPECTGICTIWGPGGSGKTHLVSGICRLWQHRFGESTAAYFTAPDFRRDLADAISNQSVNEWRSQIRSLRVLALDDVHRMTSDAYLNEELVHTLDALVESGSLVLITSNEPPSSIPKLSAAVIDRLRSGLVVPLAVAGPEVRAELARQIAQQMGTAMSPEVASLVAEQTPGGLVALGQVVAELVHDADSHVLSRDHVARFLNQRQDDRRPCFSDILRVVAKYYGVSQKVLKGSCRRQSVVMARAMLIYLARRLGGMSYQQIGRGLSGRDHTTIIHSYRKTEALAEHDRATQQALNDLQRLLSVP